MASGPIFSWHWAGMASNGRANGQYNTGSDSFCCVARLLSRRAFLCWSPLITKEESSYVLLKFRESYETTPSPVRTA